MSTLLKRGSTLVAVITVSLVFATTGSGSAAGVSLEKGVAVSGTR